VLNKSLLNFIFSSQFDASTKHSLFGLPSLILGNILPVPLLDIIFWGKENFVSGAFKFQIVFVPDDPQQRKIIEIL